MDILYYDFFQNALIGLILVSITSALIGTYVVTRRMVFIAGGITHSCFGGLGLGYFLGMNPIFMASIFAIGSALGVEWISHKKRVREDSAIAVVWAMGMALGTLFIFLTPGYVPELTTFLFGNILTIPPTDLLIFAIYTVVLILFFCIFYRPIVACSFDSDFAKTIHLPTRIINYTMMVMVSICIVLIIRLIGIMLLMSVLTLPQMSAEIYSHRIKPILIFSIIICLISSMSGLWLSYLLNVPASATIVLMLIVVYAVARIFDSVKRRIVREKKIAIKKD